MSHALLLPALTAALTLCVLLDGAPVRHPAVPAVATAVSDLDVDVELRTGCERLIDLALGGTADAPWAIAELHRAANAPWASEALRAQAREGLDRLTLQRLAFAAR